jgi:GntR family transcriptional regulator
MILDSSNSLPLYSQLEQLLRSQIVSRQLEAGVQLPTERELCEAYQVSRITVRRAINDLARQNLVYSIPGKGTFVSMSQMRERLSPLSSFTDDMHRRGLVPSSRILQAEILPASPDIAGSMGLAVGTHVVHLRRLRMVSPSQIPVAIQSAYLPHAICPNLLRFDLQQGSLYEILKHDYHLDLDRGETTVCARLALADESELLGIKLPAAVLVSDQLTFLRSGDVVEMVNSVFRSDLYQLTVIK